MLPPRHKGRPILRGAGPRVLAALLLASSVLLGAASPAWSRDSVLIVGNSFTRGLRRDLGLLLRSAGRDAEVQVRGGNGRTLEHHLRSAATLRKIHSKAWTAVVLQEQSDGMLGERYPSARALDAEITAVGSRTMFLLTWADRDDDLDMYDFLRGHPDGSEGCVPIALELGAGIAPVGWAFREAFLEDAAVDLWASDSHHASRRGQYLAALVLYASIFGESPVGLAPSRKGTPAQSLHDQMLAEAVVLGDPTAWNLGVP
jgi:hypothetical protein